MCERETGEMTEKKERNECHDVDQTMTDSNTFIPFPFQTLYIW